MLDTIYLDYNATAPLRPEAAAAMQAFLGPPANPSSVHGYGQHARALLDEARAEVAALAGCSPEAVIFTSGGTEANAIALGSHASEYQDDALIMTTAIEHDAVLAASRSAERLPVTATGIVCLDTLESRLQAMAGQYAPECDKGPGKKLLLSVMAANNETGVVQPLAEIIALARRYGGLVHSDAVQAFGKLPLPAPGTGDRGLDMMSISAHKIGGPAGVGALLMREGLAIRPLAGGGGQESNRRPGTENLIGIIGFGAAARATRLQGAWPEHLPAWQRQFEQRIKAAAPEAVIFGTAAERLGNTSCIAMPGRRAETQVISLDLAGIAVSAGAACSSGKVSQSHVLAAMGAGSLAESAIRVSAGWASQRQDFDRLAEAWIRLYKQG